jgi:hypothetical protein
LANYDAALLNQWIAKREAQIVLDDFLVIDGRGLLLVGPVGVERPSGGGILRELIERYQLPGLFYQFGRCAEIQDSYNPISQTSELRCSTGLRSRCPGPRRAGGVEANRLGAGHDDANHQHAIQR